MFYADADYFKLGEHICLAKVELKEGQAEHTHDFLELAYIETGRVWHIAKEERRLLKEGDYVIIDYDRAHGYERIDDKPVGIINCLFKPELIDLSLKNCRSLNQVLNNYLITLGGQTKKKGSFIHSFDKNKEVLWLLNKIAGEYENKMDGFWQMIRAHMIEIIIIMMREYKRKNEAQVIVQYGDEIRYMYQYIEENYNRQILLSEMAKKLNLSENYLSHLFKARTGETITDHVQRVRTAHACRLLCNTGKKVSDIAFAVGYSDYNFFNKIFKKVTGKSPLQYKKAWQAPGKADD